METTLHKDLGSADFGVLYVRGNFTANGSSALSAAAFVGKGWTAVYTSTGLYTLTLTNWTGSPAFLTGSLALKTTATNHDFQLQLGAYSASAGTFIIKAMVGTTLTDINANDIVCFDLAFIGSGAA